MAGAMSRIKTLSPDQRDRISEFRGRWWEILTLARSLDPEKAKAAAQNSYVISGLGCPEVMIFQGPLDFRDYLLKRPLSERLDDWGAPILQLPLADTLSDDLYKTLEPSLIAELRDELDSQRLSDFSALRYGIFLEPLLSILPQNGDPIPLSDAISGRWLEKVAQRYWQSQQQQWQRELRQQPGGDWLLNIGETLWTASEPFGQWVTETIVEPLLEPILDPLRNDPILQELESGLKQILGFLSLFGLGLDAITPSAHTLHPVVLDYCDRVLNSVDDTIRWGSLRSLYTDCGLMITFEKVCFLFDRPTQICLDEQGRLHGEGEPALVFGDGYTQYYFQGVNLPLRYGPIHPNQWQSRWILEEPNAELRRVLIQGIGYSRLCQELQARELDSWREYTLLLIEQPVDVEPIFLLKMTCPSTGSIHATRVPPSVETAREAIQWVNWEIDPEEFGIET